MAMARFPVAHATHPQWAMAVSLVVAQLGARLEKRWQEND